MLGFRIYLCNRSLSLATDATTGFFFFEGALNRIAKEKKNFTIFNTVLIMLINYYSKQNFFHLLLYLFFLFSTLTYSVLINWY